MLPVLDYPIFSDKLPVSKQDIKFRPLRVREEKILLTAKEGNNNQQILDSIIAVLNNCIITKSKSLDVADFPLIDVEYLFLQIYAKSAGEQFKTGVVDSDDQKTYPIVININEIKVQNLPNNIITENKLSISLRPPSLKTCINLTDQEDIGTEIVRNCIDVISYNGQAYKFQDATKEEQLKFIDDLSIDMLSKIKNYFSNLPSLKYSTKYTNSLGQEKTIEVESIFDFFI